MLDEWEMLHLGTGIVMCRRITTDRMSDPSSVHDGPQRRRRLRTGYAGMAALYGGLAVQAGLIGLLGGLSGTT